MYTKNIEDIYNLKETANLLRISVSMLRKLIRNKEINYLKTGNRFYFSETNIKSYLKESEVLNNE